MMSKAEINQELNQWVSSEEFTPNKDKVNDLNTRYDALRAEADQKAKEAFEPEEGEEQEFTPEPDDDDHRFKELMDIYHEKRKTLDKAKREAEQQNLKEKKILIEELQGLIQDEENIGKAYKRFNAIKQKWNEMGPAPQAERRELQAEYSRLIEQFYYNINIYRELQINDLKKNLDLKLAIIEKIKLLEKESSVNQVDFLLHQYLEEWDRIGPTFKEDWEKIRDDYKTSISSAFDRIRDHRKTVREEHGQNHEKKKALAERVKAIAEREFTDVKTVQGYTTEVIEAQKEWKHIGFAGRKRNDSIWKTFREACDAYFENRNQFLAEQNKEFDKVREVKRALVDRAKEIHKGDDEQGVANELKGLQRQWKQSGKLLPQDEYKLFREFRKYCDAFFNRKKQQQEARNAELEENLKKKEAFLNDLESKLAGDAKEVSGEEIIEQWRAAWGEIGDVGGKDTQRLAKQFEAHVEAAYAKLGVSKEEVRERQFKGKIDMLSSGKNAEDGLARERDHVRKQIKEMELGKIQLENKLEFFKFSDDSNPLKKDVLDRIAKEDDRIAAIKGKKKQIELALKEVRKSAEKAQEEPSESEES